MLPPLCAPPLQLVILLAKDSPATFDAVPARIEKEGNGLGMAIEKFRMAAYLWQAFTAEQMFRNKLGRRVFRMEEEWVTGTANYRDRELGTMRSEAKVHVVRCSKTVAELRDLDLAQQNPKANRGGDLFGIASEAVKIYFQPLPSQKQYVSVLLLDSHWDKSSQTITGHAALGGGGGEIQLAIFGSHALQTYPSSIEEVVPVFSDCTPTDTNYVANDCNESGSVWEAANIGIGYVNPRSFLPLSCLWSVLKMPQNLYDFYMLTRWDLVALTCTRQAIYSGALTRKMVLCSEIMLR